MSDSDARIPLDMEGMALVMAAAGSSALRRVKRGENLESAIGAPIESQDVLLQYIERYPDAAQWMADQLKVDIGGIRRTVESGTLPPEAESANPEVDQGAASRNLSRSIQIAVREARRKATDAGLGSITVHQLIASLLSTDGNARELLVKCGGGHDAISKVEESFFESPVKSHTLSDLFGNFQQNTRKLLDASWPKLMNEESEQISGGKYAEIRNRVYDENPDAYEKSLDIPEHFARPIPPDVREFDLKRGICLHAAGNEARVRKAPQVTLDHLFFALLQPGTDTARLFEKLGSEPGLLRQKLDHVLPRFDDGPRWPVNSRALTMTMTDNHECRYRQLGLSIDEIIGRPAEELRELLSSELVPNLEFSDLLWLRNACDETETLTGQILAEHGITKELIEQELRG